MKVAKDSGLLDAKSLTTTDIDLIFAKVKTKGAKKITFPQFKEALSHFAAKKGLTSVEDQILAVGGPIFTGTKTEKVKWHDDKTTYTGVYARGGP